METWQLGGRTLRSRLFLGTGKFGDEAQIPAVCQAAGAEVITVALRRVDMDDPSGGVLQYIPKDMILLPNTSGARTAEEAVRLARLARAMGCGHWVKIEIIRDARHLLPDNDATVRATEILASEGFVVLPYMNPDLYAARALVDAGAAAIMPLGAPIGSNRGLATKEMIRILLEEISLPVIVDAGLGRPSHAAEAMEMGAAACLVNTAIATADDPVGMARAFALAVEAGWGARHSGMPEARLTARASSPLTGFVEAL